MHGIYVNDISRGHRDVFDPCMQGCAAWERGQVIFFIWDLKVRPAAPSRALHEGGPFIVGPKPGPIWVQAGPKLGPSRAQAGSPKNQKNK